MSNINISEALGEDDYPRIAEKVKGLGDLINLPWRDYGDGDVCPEHRLNQHLSFAEYECWRKYRPQFVRQHDDIS